MLRNKEGSFVSRTLKFSTPNQKSLMEYWNFTFYMIHFETADHQSSQEYPLEGQTRVTLSGCSETCNAYDEKGKMTPRQTTPAIYALKNFS